MKLFITAASLVVLSACSTKKINGNGSGQKIEMKEAKNLRATLGQIPNSTAVHTVKAARIKGNKMILQLSYSGGCSEHIFQLIGSENIAKSLPPVRSLTLVHTTEAPDQCEALISKTLEFDISSLAYKKEKGSEILLALDGWDGKLSYVYE